MRTITVSGEFDTIWRSQISKIQESISIHEILYLILRVEEMKMTDRRVPYVLQELPF
jgi:hypothetical protein